MQDFDFCPNLIKFYPNLPNLSKFTQILPKFTQTVSKYCPNLPKKFARGRIPYIPSSYAIAQVTKRKHNIKTMTISTFGAKSYTLT